MSNSLYERLGGRDAVNTAVELFYKKVMADSRVNHFFDGVDMKRQIAKQKSFLTMVFGGPSKYDGKNLREGHKHLVAKGLNDSHFDAIVENLVNTLTELDIAAEDIQQVATIANSVKDDVLNR